MPRDSIVHGCVPNYFYLVKPAIAFVYCSSGSWGWAGRSPLPHLLLWWLCSAGHSAGHLCSSLSHSRVAPHSSGLGRHPEGMDLIVSGLKTGTGTAGTYKRVWIPGKNIWLGSMLKVYSSPQLPCYSRRPLIVWPFPAQIFEGKLDVTILTLWEDKVCSGHL